MLSKIQSEIRANKGQRNEFGKYNYRSMEDINQAVKPILAAHGLALVVSDELQLIGDRYYIKATASLVDAEGKVVASSTGYAREEETKKGMDASQITGACSSYARKYAANGLFCIDDNKDSDATNTHGKDEQKAPKDQIKQDLSNDVANDRAALLCAEIDGCMTQETLIAWGKASKAQIEKLPETQKAKVYAYWKQIEALIIEANSKEKAA